LSDMDARAALDLTALFTGIGIAISTSEWLWVRPALADGQLMSWTVSRTRHRLLASGDVGRALNWILSSRNYGRVLMGRMVFAVLAATPIAPSQLRALFWLLVFTTLALGALRSSYGQDGSDQMFMLETLGLAATLFVATENATRLFVYFIALHLAFCYVVAGSSKLFSSTWRRAAALPLIFRTQAYGDRTLHRWLVRHRRCATLGSWAIICLEVAFPLAFILPQGGDLMIAAMIMFHVAAAYWMGLNGFLLAFGAASPCALYLVR
jgi:hypothetical protein